MAIDLTSQAVTGIIVTTRAALADGDFTAAALALQQAVDAQTAHLADIAAAQPVQVELLDKIKLGLAATVTMRDLLG
jgi:hypothetical protein